MTNKNLLIVFVKNVLLGKVKTRLAASIGDFGAYEVYKELVDITETETARLSNCDIHIYFSDVVIESKWPEKAKFVQQGNDLGEKMENAFAHGFSLGYDKVVGVGSDLPDLNASIILEGFDALETADTVFGPSADGGYYLLGMKRLYKEIFKDIPWSTDTVLSDTLTALSKTERSVNLLTELNDIDNIEDLKSSSIAYKFTKYYELSRSNQ
ncbi:TIGR04282 family arsenosugar biosynthesis glycosyltransferase [Paracrocinitomix mangrovi]|uniref:TIGR04282 family arsenosugar biosynthesis glycosyltransferase n=1 Tax=Paracrocinitomix mangrovi TaxID=2862509 RepID=UPI001C8D4E6D|nr:TIGR04282 family arsenosugar biosynthesis glycosyltransferase [Paracrocinitomix mangrovi]UKN01684.1 TIGR04282 family arsenosugar biosynthesis glycosyltransferase [Paracrocinitomix mangrovi]